ncbi:MAG: hypothetical protein KAH21_10300, partial [Spirochaetaceae bacterium]|nr:hypothetical protein [Spirochaetaceae bacterium]
ESAEGKILNKLRQDAEAELGAKDREISDIRSLLDDLENQKSLLAVETESKIAERENELRKEFDAVLAVEQARLSDSGISGTDLTVALAAYEAELRSGFENDLSDAKAAATAEQERRVAELDAQRSQYEKQILAADTERNNLQSELALRTAEIEELAKVQAAEASEAAKQLDDLRVLQEQEKNITAQILAFYESVGVARSADDSEKALIALDSLDSYLTEDGIRGTGVVVRRKDIDAFLTGALRRLIALETSDDAVVVPVDDGLAEILAGLAAGAVAGTQLSDAGDIEAAQEVWRNPFSAMPELERAFGSAIAGAAVLTTAQLASARDGGLAEGLRVGRSEVETVKQEAYDSGRKNGLESMESLLNTLKDRIHTIQNQYRTALIRTEDDERDSRERLLLLLNTKLAIKSELDSSLHGSLEEFTDATGDLRELEGREDVYTEILKFLSELTAAVER